MTEEQHIHIYVDGDDSRRKPVTDGARAMNRILSRDRTRDVEMYRRRPDGQLVPALGVSGDLPDFVPASTSLGASQRSQQPWGPRDFDAPPAEDITRNHALNEANRRYYEGPGEGHEPGEVRGYGPDYGDAGQHDEYGKTFVGARGTDPTPERRSPPPPDEMDGSYLSPLAAERQFRSPTTQHQRSAGGYPDENSTGWGVRADQGRENRRVTSQGQENYGTASPNVGNPDRWTNQAGAQPTRFDPRSAGGGGSSEQASLRELNNSNRTKYGDAPLRGPLPAIQRPEPDTAAHDWQGRRTLNGRVVG